MDNKKIVRVQIATTPNSGLTNSSSANAKLKALSSKKNNVAIVVEYADGSRAALDSMEQFNQVIADYSQEDLAKIQDNGVSIKLTTLEEEAKIDKIMKGKTGLFSKTSPSAKIFQEWYELKSNQDTIPFDVRRDILPGVTVAVPAAAAAAAEATNGENEDLDDENTNDGPDADAADDGTEGTDETTDEDTDEAVDEETAETVPLKTHVNREGSKNHTALKVGAGVLAGIALAASGMAIRSHLKNNKENANAAAIYEEYDQNAEASSSELTEEEQAYLEAKSTCLETYDQIIDSIEDEELTPEQRELMKISGKEYDAARFAWVNHSADYLKNLGIGSRAEVINLRNSFRHKMMTALQFLNANNFDQFASVFDNFFETEEDKTVVREFLSNLLDKECTKDQMWATMEKMFDANRENKNLKFAVDSLFLGVASQWGKLDEETLQAHGWTSYVLPENPTQEQLAYYNNLKNQGVRFTYELLGDPACDEVFLDPAVEELFKTDADESSKFYQENQKINELHNHGIVSRYDESASILDGIIARKTMEHRGQDKTSGKTTTQSGSTTTYRTETRETVRQLSPAEAAAIAPDQKAAIDAQYEAQTEANKQAAIKDAEAKGYTDVTENWDDVKDKGGTTVESVEKGDTVYTNPDVPAHDTETHKNPVTGETVVEQTPSAPTGEGSKWTPETLGAGDGNYDYSQEVNNVAPPVQEAQQTPPTTETTPQQDQQVETPDTGLSQGGITHVEEGEFEAAPTAVEAPAPVVDAPAPAAEESAAVAVEDAAAPIAVSEESLATVIESLSDDELAALTNEVTNEIAQEATDEIGGPTL